MSMCRLIEYMGKVSLYTFSIYFFLGVPFLSLLETGLLAGWASGWSWHEYFLFLCGVGARLWLCCTVKHGLLTDFLIVLHERRNMRMVLVELLLRLAPVHGKSISQQVSKISCISDHNQLVLPLIIFSLLDRSVPWWLLTPPHLWQHSSVLQVSQFWK